MSKTIQSTPKALVESVTKNLPAAAQGDFRNLMSTVVDNLTAQAPGGNLLQIGGAKIGARGSHSQRHRGEWNLYRGNLKSNQRQVCANLAPDQLRSPGQFHQRRDHDGADDQHLGEHPGARRKPVLQAGVELRQNNMVKTSTRLHSTNQRRPDELCGYRAGGDL